MITNNARNLGFPRMGKRRELKFAVEKCWANPASEPELLTTAQQLRKEHWKLQIDAGVAVPPSNDFSLYDHVLDMAVTLGAIPKRFGSAGAPISLATYFAMARGAQQSPALEMTKWFDTNYHYVVPEFELGMSFALRSTKAVNEYLEARGLGIETRPVILGPVSFVLLGKPTAASASRGHVLEAIIPLYVELLTLLNAAGASWVQLDEPCLGLDLDAEARKFYTDAFAALRGEPSLPKLMLTTYFGAIGDNLDLALSLGTAGLHLDLVRAPKQLETVLAKKSPLPKLSLGLVNGRNVWRTDLTAAVAKIETAVKAWGRERIEVAPSCSLLHSPVDLDLETSLDPEIRHWMAFAKQKLQEVSILAKAIEAREGIGKELAASDALVLSRKNSSRTHKPELANRMAAVTDAMTRRKSPYPKRREIQAEVLSLPTLPTTTIGSFPQTPEVRKMRAAFRSGKIDQEAYDRFVEEEIRRCILFQEEVGLDVLVHGEFERNDMVEYFGEQLEGFVFSENGWGAKLWVAVCEASHYLWRRIPPTGNDGALVEICAIGNETCGERNVDGAGYYLAMVVCARRSAPLGELQANCTGHPRRGRGSGGGRDQSDPN